MNTWRKCEWKSTRLIAAWLECFPEKPSWYRSEEVCQELKWQALWGVQRLNTALHKTYLDINSVTLPTFVLSLPRSVNCWAWTEIAILHRSENFTKYGHWATTHACNFYPASCHSKSTTAEMSRTPRIVILWVMALCPGRSGPKIIQA